jgi:hypothetical protein
MNRYDPKRDGVTQGLLGTFMACRRKAQLTLNRWSSMRLSMPLFFGTAFHYACEFHYEHLTRRKPVPGKASVLFAERQARKELEQKTFVSEQDEQNIELALSILEVQFPAYVAFYQKADAKLNWLESENEFDVPHGPMHLRGKIDGCFEAPGKKLWIKDTKTKARLEENSLLDLLTLDLQIGLYLLASEIKSGRRVHGFQYDMVRRPELRLLQRETVGEFQNRVAADINKRPEHYFKRLNISLTKEDRARFLKDLLIVFTEFMSWCRGELPTYHNTSACMTRYGACMYLPICARNDYTGFKQRDVLYPELEG